jgi:hypothetical protein
MSGKQMSGKPPGGPSSAGAEIAAVVKLARCQSTRLMATGCTALRRGTLARPDTP